MLLQPQEAHRESRVLGWGLGSHREARGKQHRGTRAPRTQLFTVPERRAETSPRLGASCLLANPSSPGSHETWGSSGVPLGTHPQLDWGCGCSDTKELTALRSLKIWGRKRPLFTWGNSQEPPGATNMAPTIPKSALTVLFDVLGFCSDDSHLGKTTG